jgi:UDP:flavonoid glycosyltransferase YjiC (YdhE family)
VFLPGGAPPVLITLGASSSLDPRGFYPRAAEAVTQLGHRALVLTGPTPENAAEPPSDDRVMTIPYAPLSLVAEHCLAAIHHGGVGTAVGLLLAGLPQLVVPRAFDQPQTAVRLTRLGVARSLGWRRARAKAIAGQLAPLLSDTDYRRNAFVIRERLVAEDGLGMTVQAVEAILDAS